MGRDIKFRAWHTYHKFMFQVMEVTCDAQYASGFSRVVAYPFDDWNKSENERGEWANNAPRARTHYLHHEIDNLELMQFTGLKDKNGRDIYEGDIVATHPGEDYVRGIVRIGETEICEDMGEFNHCSRYYGVYLERLYDFEEELLDGKLLVIGNCYEHPELLNKAE